jgi:hypothetical protein
MANATTTRVGIILECGPDGADVQVCRFLARLLAPNLEPVPVTLGNKPALLRDCGAAAAQLLAEACVGVLIVWDLYPPWRERKPCRREDREAIGQSLATAGVGLDRAALVCIQEELEAWLIADGRALSAVLSTPTHPVRVKDARKPERCRNPKKALNRVFKQHTGKPYVDRWHAIQIVRQLPDLTRLGKLATFERFRQLLLAMQ